MRELLRDRERLEHILAAIDPLLVIHQENPMMI